jgi:hypothetical protein
MLHKLRSGLTALGVIFGVAAVISMLRWGRWPEAMPNTASRRASRVRDHLT